MNKKFTLVIALVSLSISIVSAQKKNPFKDFKAGIVITNTNDTLEGKINNKSFYKNSKVCEFLNSKGEIIKYTPNDITAFKFYNGKYYVTTELDGKKVFLEYLIKGKLNVHYLQNNKKEDIYFTSTDSIALYQLKYENSTITNDGTVRVKKKKLFINQLNYFTRDYPELSSSINKINEPNHKDLIKVARQYHEFTCKDGSECIVFEKTEKRKILVGFSLSGNRLVKALDDYDFKSNYLMYNASIHFQQFRKSEKLFVGIGVNAAGDGSLESKETPGKIIQGNVQIPLSFSYIIIKNGLTPTFSYSFDLNSFLFLQNIQAGIRYQKRSFSIYSNIGVSTANLTALYNSNVNVGIQYQLKRN
jgi:hypothetical protein